MSSNKVKKSFIFVDFFENFLRKLYHFKYLNQWGKFGEFNVFNKESVRQEVERFI